MGKRENKKDPDSKKKKRGKSPIPPKKEELGDNQDQNEFGGMDMSNFRKNLGCG